MGLLTMSSKLVHDVLVHRCPVLGTDLVYYSAWEITKPRRTGRKYGHGSITHEGVAVFGKIGTDDLTQELIDLPPGRQKMEAVHAYQALNCQRAYIAILTTYPQLALAETYRTGTGEIVATEAGAGKEKYREYIGAAA